MYPGPNHMRDRHGNNPDSRPDQRMSLTTYSENKRDERTPKLDDEERRRLKQAARTLRENGRYHHPTPSEPEPPSPALFAMVPSVTQVNLCAKMFGTYSSFASRDENLELMGVDHLPSTSSPAIPSQLNGHDQSDKRQGHRHSSNFRPPATISPAKPSPRPSQHNETKLPEQYMAPKLASTPVKSKPALFNDDPKLTRIFNEMDNLPSPISDIEVTPVQNGEPSAFPFTIPPPKKDAKMSKSNPPRHQPAPAQPLENYHCDLSDDSDLDIAVSPVKASSANPPARLREGSTTSQNSDDSSNSEDSSCSDSEDSSSNSSEEEDKPVQPDPSQMPPSPASSMSWSLEKIFQQPNGNPTKEDIPREQEIGHKPYDVSYDSLSRSPQSRTDLAPPIVTKSPAGRVRRLTETSEESGLDSSINSFKSQQAKEMVIAKYFETKTKPPNLSESELDLDTAPVTSARAQNVSMRAKETYDSQKKLAKSSSALKSGRERSSRRSAVKDKITKHIKSIETIPSDLDTDSDDCTDTAVFNRSDIKKVSKAPSKREGRKETGSKIRSSNNSLLSKRISPVPTQSVMSPPTIQEIRPSKTITTPPPQRDHRHTKIDVISPSLSQRESRYQKVNDMSPPPLPRESRHSSRSSEIIQKASPSLQHSKRSYHSHEKVEVDRCSRKVTRETASPKDAKRRSSPSYTLSIKNKLQIPKIAVCYGKFPSAVLLIPIDFVKPMALGIESPVKQKITEEVIEMRTSPSNEDGTKLRAIISIFMGSKKRPNSQEPEHGRKVLKLEEKEPPQIPEVKATSKTSTSQLDSHPRHNSTRHRISTKEPEKTCTVKEKTREIDKYQPKDKKRRRKISDESEYPKKRNKTEAVVTSGHEADSKSRTSKETKKEAYRSYVKEATSPVGTVRRSSSRGNDLLSMSHNTTSQNVDMQEFASSERNSDDDSCFRTPQQVHSYGFKQESSSKRQEKQVYGKGAPTLSTVNPTIESTSSTPVPTNTYFSYLEKKIPAVETDHMQYLLKAKELKHQADKESNRTLQVMIYLESGLYFILTGESMEQETSNVTASFSMYNDTLKFIRHVSSIIVRKESFKDDPANNNLNSKLAVLSLRCQSLLYLKLYTMRSGEANEVQKDLAEYFKVASKSPTVPMTCYPGGATSVTGGICGRMANSPSNLSPTPSPAGSVGSEGSQSSSGYGTEGASQRAVAGVMSATPPMTHTNSGHLVPKHTFVSLQRHLSISNFLVAAHHHWKESDSYIYEYNTKDFFIEMDHELGPLTLHSTPSELVMYVQKSLDKLKAQQCIGCDSRSGSSMA